MLDLHWSRDSRIVFSASADMMLASWDTETGQRLRRHMGHEEVINSLDVSRRGEEILVSGSDDGYIGVRILPFLRPRLTVLTRAYKAMGSSTEAGH